MPPRDKPPHPLEVLGLAWVPVTKELADRVMELLRDAGELLEAGKPSPTGRRQMHLDLYYLCDEALHRGEHAPGTRRLARRWGVSRDVARGVVDAYRATVPEHAPAWPPATPRLPPVTPRHREEERGESDDNPPVTPRSPPGDPPASPHARRSDPRASSSIRPSPQPPAQAGGSPPDDLVEACLALLGELQPSAVVMAQMRRRDSATAKDVRKALARRRLIPSGTRSKQVAEALAVAVARELPPPAQPSLLQAVEPEPETPEPDEFASARWRSVRRQLETELGHADVAIWCGRCVPVELGERRLTLWCPTEVHADWVATHQRAAIETALGVEVELVHPPPPEATMAAQSAK